MMHFNKPQPILFFLSVLLVFAACKKNSNDSGPAPVTDPLSLAAAKPGDTIVIKGENFSEVAANNTVKFNGVTATVVSATATELRVVIPGNATSGPITVTVNGATTEVGSLVLAPLTLYCLKEDTVNKAPEQLVAIDPSSGQESLIASLGDLPGYAIPDILYLAATNEVIYYNDSATALVKINVTTKQTSTLRLAGSGVDVRYEELVTDKSGNLYAIKTDDRNANDFIETMVKVDPKTGNTTDVKILGRNNYIHWTNLLYLPTRNEIIGTTEEQRLFHLNLNTKDTGSVKYADSYGLSFTEWVADKQGNLIACKDDLSVDNDELVQVNPVTGTNTLITSLNHFNTFHATLWSLPERNEIAGIWDFKGLYKFNLSTKASSVLPLTAQTNINYVRLTSN